MRRRQLVFLFLATQVFGCSAAQTTVADLQLRRLRPDAPVFTLNSGLDEATQRVVQNQQELDQLWQQLVGNNRPAANVPAVDFTQDVVVVVGLGRKRSGGHTVQIDRVGQRGDVLVVHARAVAPGRGCIVSSAVTSPADVALLRRPAGAIVIEVETVVVDCHGDQ
jgi:PrcB C-terminal